MFAVPDSDPPSTPDSRRGSEGPSTTPAGPPPTGYTGQSFTPSGPPPKSSLFGDSYLDAFNNTNALSNNTYALSNTNAFNNTNTFPNPYVNPTGAKPKSGAFAPPSSPPQPAPGLFTGNFNGGFSGGLNGGFTGGLTGGYTAAMGAPFTGGLHGMRDDGSDGYSEDALDFQQRPSQPAFTATNNLPSKHSMADSQAYSDYDSPRSLKRSRYGQVMGNSLRSSRAARLDNRQPAVAAIAKGFAQPASSSLDEPDDLILKSELLLSNLDAELKRANNPDSDTLTTKTAQQLADLWKKYVSSKSIPGDIGPNNQKSALNKSNYIASLLLRMYHPITSQHKPKAASSAFGRSSRFMDLVIQREDVPTVPKSLLDWLNTYHNPYPEDLQEILNHKPSPIAHERFWDMVFATTLRGDLATVIDLLENADFTQADSAMDDGYDDPGYYGHQADAARYVTLQCVELLKSCPAYTDGDWDVKNSDWAIFRNRVRREHDELEAYAESDSRDRDTAMNGDNVFNSSAPGPGRNGLSFSTASRRAESKVPWSVYTNLKVLYGQLQGQQTEISVCTQDWLEAVIFLTVWWDGEDKESLTGNLAASRRSMRQSQQIRPVDVSPTSAYRRQLLFAFASVTDDPEDSVFSVNTANPLQVALACICEEDVQGVLGILRTWSLPLASAVVDIAGAAGWLPQTRVKGDALLDGFDRDDLMVLSHGQDDSPDGFKRDDILATYAQQLSREDKFTSSDGKTSKEGWDLACRVLSRLDSLDTAQRKTSELLSQLALDSTERVDRVLAVCADIGLPDQVHAIAERYADTLAETSQSYGSALIYYARAHSHTKLKSTIDLLISMCLVQSAAFPPRTSLDPQLAMMLNDQRAAITKLSKIDSEAALLIATYLSGYATLRKFYELRDEQESDDVKSGFRPYARNREAAKALLALIESAADSIRGGLFDAEVETVVQVDTLMALLCEALPLMNHRKQVLQTPELLVLLRAVEDLESVTPLVYDQAESLFRSAVSNYCESPTHLISSQDLAKSISGNLMGKSTTSLSASSYGMIGSNGSLATTNGDEGEKVEVKRGWDWRAGAARLGKNVKGEEVLRVLRSQVAKDMAAAWMQI